MYASTYPQDIAHVIDTFVITGAMDTLGKRIKQRREELGLDQVALANKVGMSQPNLAHLESGRNHRTKYLPEIARELGVTAEWLSTGGGELRIAVNNPLPEVTTSEAVRLLNLYEACDEESRTLMMRSAETLAELSQSRRRRIVGDKG
jgi:transcriptional regulator with XRE-family HTH domain